MPETTFLKFKDDHGVTADGNLEPLVAIGLAIPVPVMVPDPDTKKLVPGETTANVLVKPAEQLGNALARIVPGTRFIEVFDFRIAQALIRTEKWERVDPVSKAEAAKAAKALTDASTEAGTHADPNDPDGTGQTAGETKQER